MINIESLPKQIQYQGDVLHFIDRSDTENLYLGYSSGKKGGYAFVGKFSKKDPDSEHKLELFLNDICKTFQIKVAENKPKKIIKMDSTPKTAAEIIAELQALDTTALDAVVAGIAQAVTDLQALPASPVAPTVASVAVTFTDGSSQTVPPATA